MKHLVVTAIASSILLASTPAYAAPKEPKPPAQELIAETKRYKLAFEVLKVEEDRYQGKITLTNLKPWIIWNWGIALAGGDKIESSPDAKIAHLDNGMTYLRPHRPDHNALGYGVDTITFWAKLAPGKKPAPPSAAWVLDKGKTPKSDSDNDGIPDFAETTLKLDPRRADTDGDGLDDRAEFGMRLDPTRRDSDGNGVSDIDEDPDKDGVTTRQEIKDRTGALTPDTDFDGLNDGEEKKHRTDPVKADTDGDGVKDGEEVRIGSNPLVAEQTFSVTRSAPGQPTSPSVTLQNLTAEQVNSFSVSRLPKDLPRFPTTIPGYLDNPYEFQVKGKFAEAKVSFAVDKKLLTPGVEPALYRFDEESQRLVRVPGQVFADGKVTATLNHFSTYMLLDQKKFDEVWKATFKEVPDEPKSYERLDMVFTLDSSGSMDWNDKRNERVQVTKNFIDRLGAQDRAAVVDFDGSATILQGLTKDKDALKSSLSRIDSNGSTDLTAGISTSLAALKGAGGDKTLKTVVFLTDGEGNYDEGLTAKAKAEGVRIYTIGLGSSVDAAVLRRIADGTGGKYFAVSRAEELSEVFTSIAEEADLTRDSDGDGLSDYWEKQMRAGKLRLGTGVPLSLMDPNNPDSDGDGLKDGEEVQVKRVPGAGEGGATLVYVTMKSNPMRRDSDRDSIPDRTDNVPLVHAPKNQLIFQSANLLGKRKPATIADDPSGTEDKCDKPKNSPTKTPSLLEKRVALDLTYGDYSIEEMRNFFRKDRGLTNPSRVEYGAQIGEGWLSIKTPVLQKDLRRKLHKSEFFALIFGVIAATDQTTPREVGHDSAQGLADAYTEFMKGSDGETVGCKANFDAAKYRVLNSPALARAVKRHPATVSYVDTAVERIRAKISGNKGSIEALTVKNTIPSSSLYKPLTKNLRGPVYGGLLPTLREIPNRPSAYADYMLGLAIHAFHGNSIELKDYKVANGQYSGTLEFTFYDHFGLDDDDWQASSGFPAWFALQHDRDYGSSGGKPPIVAIKVTRQISGTTG